MASIVIRRPQKPIFRKHPRVLVSPNARVLLIGVSATGSAGTFTPSVQAGTLSGVSATGAAGTFTPTVQPGLTGAAGTGAAGSLAPTVQDTITGVAGTGAAGALGITVTENFSGVSGSGSVAGGTAELDIGLTGVSGTSGVNTFNFGTGPVNLVGTSATGSVGTFAPTVSITLPGVAGTGAAGTFTPTVQLTITGASGTGSAGIFAPGVQITITGALGTGAAGVFVPTVSSTLIGVPATGSAGVLAPTVAQTLPGVVGTGAAGTFTPTIAITLPGVAGTGAAGTFTPTVQDTLIGVAGTSSAGIFAPGVQITITGASATGAVGAFVPTVLSTLVGVTGTGSAGVFVPTVQKTLTGVTGTGAAGTFTPTVQLTITGVTGTGAAGVFTPTVQLTIAGVTGTGAAGVFVPTVSNTLVGVSGTGTAGVAGTSTGFLFGAGAVGSAGVFTPTVADTLTGVSSTGAAGTFAKTMSLTLIGASGTGAAGVFAPTVTPTFLGVSAFAGYQAQVTVWDASTIPDAQSVLSNGNLTATCNSFGNTGPLSTTSQWGKVVFKGTWGVVAQADTDGFGLTNAAFVPAAIASGFPDTYWIGIDTNSIAIYNDGQVWYNGASIFNTGFIFAANDFVVVAADITAQRIWFQKNGTGNWNGDPAANPATGVNGIPMGFMGPAFAACVTFSNPVNSVVTADFNATGISLPANFVTWNTYQLVGEMLPQITKGFTGVSATGAVNAPSQGISVQAVGQAGLLQGEVSVFFGAPGTFTDATDNHYDLTNVGASIDPAGRIGAAVSFNGSSYAIMPPGPFAGWDTRAPFTFSVWFKTTGKGVIFGQTDGTQLSNTAGIGGWVPALYVGNDGKLYDSLFWHNDTTFQNVTAGTVNDGSWHLATITYDGNKETLYVDGSSVASKFSDQFSYSANYSYFLGASYATGWPNVTVDVNGISWFTGSLDDVRVYQRALKASEVASLYAGNGPTDEVGYWSFDTALGGASAQGYAAGGGAASGVIKISFAPLLPGPRIVYPDHELRLTSADIEARIAQADVEVRVVPADQSGARAVQVEIESGGVTITPVTMVTVTLDPAKASTGVVLSNGNLTATPTPFAVPGFNYINVASTLPASGKHVYKVVFNATPVDPGVGIASGNLPITTADFMGGTNGFGFFLTEGSGGNGWYREISLGDLNFAPPVMGDFYLVAVDTVAQRIWIRKNNTGSWNGSFGSGAGNDPATGIGGFSFAGLPGSIYAAVSFGTWGATPDAPMTFDFSPVEALPHGFTPWATSLGATSGVIRGAVADKEDRTVTAEVETRAA